MVESRWKLARLKRMESALVQQMAGQDTEHSNPDAVVAAAMLAGNANAYASIQRYQAAAERSYFKAKQELDRERARAVQNEPKPAPQPSANILDYLRKSLTPDAFTKRNPANCEPKTENCELSPRSVVTEAGRR
jgi:hypothetical protein